MASVLHQGGTEAHKGAIRSGTRYAKWAGGSRSQTHRRAAMGGFTQDDGDVQGVAPMHCARPPRILLNFQQLLRLLRTHDDVLRPGTGGRRHEEVAERKILVRKWKGQISRNGTT
jgi:hypothetical protein